ncbi:carotenoid-cleaving dioxygenase, mitochondrial-like [Ruditapes philippinarum]|uniref:carotenoid-cleaving dioxygenase, mitochondrial-like n=1 Tax=Ruditapes philippinarum TaxID=129788 RepID=UPI00295AE29E|nr:carotenoid-cleaving dioxygenase, mitochondrial-like [Ruditapes philippinarum]
MLKLARSSSTVGVAAASMHKLYKTIENEVEEPLQGTVKGSIPVWIKGSLYRNGPGMFEVGEHKFKHWFDGMSMLQRFHISDGKVTYQRKFLRSDTFLNNTTSGRITINEFATAASPDPCKNIFQRFLTIFETDDMSDNTLVNVFPLKDELYTTTEIKYLNKIDPETLDRTEKNVPAKKEGETEFPAGEIVFKTQSPWKIHFNYYHSFSMTENYFVFVQQPLLSNVPKILLGRKTGYAFASSLTGYPEIKNRFRIVDRKTGEEINADHVIESDAFLYFHQINAYEEQGHIIVDISCHEDTKVLERFYMKNLTSKEYEENLKNASEPEPRRYVIPLDLGKEEKGGDMVSLERTTAKCKKIDDKTFHLQPEILADIGLEFPQINYRKYNTKKYRYIYGVAFRHKKNPLTTLAKVDASTKTYIEWEEDKCYPSEPVFVPKPRGASEDDGVVVAAVNRVGEGDDDNSCFLLVLDAKSFTEIARVEFEGIERFPYDFHGVYADDKSLKKA